MDPPPIHKHPLSQPPPPGTDVRTHYPPTPLPPHGIIVFSGPSLGPPKPSPGTFLRKMEKENQPSLGVGAARIDVLGWWLPRFPLCGGNRSAARMKPREKWKPGTEEGCSPQAPSATLPLVSCGLGTALVPTQSLAMLRWGPGPGTEGGGRAPTGAMHVPSGSVGGRGPAEAVCPAGCPRRC